MEMQVIRNSSTWLEIMQPFEDVDPESLLCWFLEPEKIARWWGPQATIDARPGGEWTIHFPQMNSTLTGEIAQLEPQRLTVSRAFTTEPELPARIIIVTTQRDDNGSLLRIVQGPYRQSESLPHEDSDRAAHLEGWEFFLGRLASVVTAHTNASA